MDRWRQQARDYRDQVRSDHPEATPQQFAEMVKDRHALLARMEGAAAGVPGAMVPLAGAMATVIPDLAALAWIQSRMVIHIAAVYGRDTSNREMAAELLVLQGIYSATEAARIALTQASQRVATRLVDQYIKGGTLVLIRQLFKYVGIRFYANRPAEGRAVHRRAGERGRQRAVDPVAGEPRDQVLRSSAA